MAEPSLYERLGGVFAIAAVVDHFSDAVVQNPIVGQGVSKKTLSFVSGTRGRWAGCPGLEIHARAAGLQRRRWTLLVLGHEAGKHPTRAGRGPSRPATSPPMSSTR